MTAIDSWVFDAHPLPHLRMELAALHETSGVPGPRSSVSVVRTIGDATGRPDLGYADDGVARSLADRRRLAEALGAGPARLVFMEQVHGAGVTLVDDSAAGAGLENRSTALAGTDAMITGVRGLGLVGLAADCPLVALWDEEARWCALAHAGWRGLAAGVLANVVAKLAAQGARAGRLHAAIGPHIGPCCYEVKADVLGSLLRTGGARPEHVRRDAAQQTCLDLGAAVRYQLAAAGVDAARVSGHDECTCCRPELYHSYRRDGAAAGRQAMAVCLPQAGSGEGLKG